MKKTLLLLGTLLLTVGSAFAYSMPRWGMTAIDVYLPENQYSQLVRSSFEEWSNASGGRVRFRYASTRFASTNAPIKVVFLNEQTRYYLTQSQRSETTGYFTNMDQGFISRATLTIYEKNRFDEIPDPDQLRSEVLHEIGYILGLEKIFRDCGQEEQDASIMCVPSLSKDSSITDLDRASIVRKYDRSNDDIKQRKNRN